MFWKRAIRCKGQDATKRHHVKHSAKSYLDLCLTTPERASDRIWCDELRAWVFAGRSGSGHGYRWIVPTLGHAID